MSKSSAKAANPAMDLSHALHVAALRLWRRFPWPGGRGRYFFKQLLLGSRRGLGARPIPTDVGWLWLEWGEDELQSTLYASGEHYEEEVTAYLGSLDLEGALVVDVGAHAGFYAVLLAQKVGSSGQVLAFEPQSKLADGVERSLAAASFSWASVRRMAVGDRDGSLTLHVSKDSGRSSAGSLPDADAEAREVPMVRLDDFLRREVGGRCPALIKIDIEGAEWLALGGLGKLLAGAPAPILVIEMHPRQIEDLGGSQRAIVETLEKHGYRVQNLHHRDGLGPLPSPLPTTTTWHIVAQKEALRESVP